MVDRVNGAIWERSIQNHSNLGPPSNKPIKRSTCQITKQNVSVYSTSNHNSGSEEVFRLHSYICYTRSLHSVATFDSTTTVPQRNFFIHLRGKTDYPIQEVAGIVNLFAENEIQMPSVLHEPIRSVEI